MKKEQRQHAMIQDLIVAQAPLGLDYFMTHYQVKLRTLRYDLEAIKEQLAKQNISLVLKHQQGYYIPFNEKPLLKDMIQSIDSETDNQKLYLMLLFQTAPMSAQALGNRLHRSESSILKQLKHLLVPQQVKIQFEKYKGISLVGDEYLIRKTAVYLISPLFNSINHLADVYPIFEPILKPFISLESLKAFELKVKALNQTYNIWSSKQSYLKFVSYWLISHVRIKLGFNVDTELKLDDQFSGEIAYIKALSEEKIEAKELIMSVKELLNQGIFVNVVCDDKVLSSLVDEMIQQLKDPHDYDAQLKEDLLTHLFHYIRRTKLGVHVEGNPLLSQVKGTYYAFYEEARRLSHYIETAYDIKVLEDELSFIAIYLYKHYTHKPKTRHRVLVVCATGKGLSQLLQARIRNVFHEFDIVGVVSSFSEMIEQTDSDLIISTIPLTHTSKEVVIVSPILGIDDIQRIQAYLSLGQMTHYLPVQATVDTQYLTLNHQTWIDYSRTMRQINMSLLEIVSQFKTEFNITHERILGLMIHVSVGVERWMQVDVQADEEATRRLDKHHQDYPALYEAMCHYFDYLEKMLQIILCDNERLAFFHYLV